MSTTVQVTSFSLSLIHSVCSFSPIPFLCIFPRNRCIEPPTENVCLPICNFATIPINSISPSQWNPFLTARDMGVCATEESAQHPVKKSEVHTFDLLTACSEDEAPRCHKGTRVIRGQRYGLSGKITTVSKSGF